MQRVRGSLPSSLPSPPSPIPPPFPPTGRNRESGWFSVQGGAENPKLAKLVGSIIPSCGLWLIAGTASSGACSSPEFASDPSEASSSDAWEWLGQHSRHTWVCSWALGLATKSRLLRKALRRPIQQPLAPALCSLKIAPGSSTIT